MAPRWKTGVWSLGKPASTLFDVFDKIKVTQSHIYNAADSSLAAIQKFEARLEETKTARPMGSINRQVPGNQDTIDEAFGHLVPTPKDDPNR